MQTNKTKLLNNLVILFVLFMLILNILLFVGCNCSVPESSKNMPLTVEYVASTGGSLKIGEDPNNKNRVSQRVVYGDATEKVTAVPDMGYYFVQWSDELTDSTRLDTNITSNLQFVAEFAVITDVVNITYTTLGSGYVFGYTNQMVQRGTEAQPVKAMLYGNSLPGEIFVRWSDGVTNPDRQDKKITDDMEIVAEFGYTVNYAVQGKGSIVGNAEQAVVWGQTAETVTAVPDKGYRFVKWSDGVKTSTRQDRWVSEPIDVYAIFEWRDTDTFVYHYNYATGNYYENGLTLMRGEVVGTTAIVPTRDYFTFDGWYLDEQFTQRATDSMGRNLLGEEIFNSPSRDLYAKWNVKEHYVVNYKILMVYVTAIDGTFVGNDGKIVDVHYRMSEDLKLQCIELTKLLRDTLNGMLDGLVNFEVHSFFTTQLLSEQNFLNIVNGTCIYANQIPELIGSNVLEEYRSVITFFSFGGESNLSVNWAGTGGEKYATIPIDENVRGYENFIEALADYSGLVSTCVHEFIHTIEFNIVCYEYHHAYNPAVPRQILDKLYLLNQFPSDFYVKLGDNPELWTEECFVETWRNSEKAGVPYGYWTDEIFDVLIKAECINGQPDGYGGVGTVDTGGYIAFSNSNMEERDLWHNLGAPGVQRVPKGSRTTMFFAVPKNGYRFIGWSDGVQDELRVLTDVQKNITLIAYFERLHYTVEYIAGEGGRIEGELIQTLLTGERTTEVTAIPHEGYRFVGWSDGRTGATRSDSIGQNEYDENGDWYYRLGFTVTARFEKIE